MTSQVPYYVDKGKEKGENLLNSKKKFINMPFIFCMLHISVFIQQSLNRYTFIHTFTITAAKTYKLVGTVAKHLLSQINMHFVYIYSITAPYHFFQNI